MTNVKTNSFFKPGEKVRVTDVRYMNHDRLKLGEVFTIRQDLCDGYVTVEEDLGDHNSVLARWRLARIGKSGLGMAEEAANSLGMKVKRGVA